MSLFVIGFVYTHVQIDTLHGQMAGQWVSAILRMIYHQKFVVSHIYWRHERTPGIVLVWGTRTRGAHRTLQLIFGLTGTPLAKLLYFGWCMILRVLLHDPLARLVLPYASHVNQFKQAIIGRHPHLDDVAFSADGPKLTIESTAR